MVPARGVAPLPIRTRGLSKRYGTVQALDALDLDVPAGSIFGFLGPNGAGKTTTIRLLTALGRPTGGEAWIGEVPAADGAPGRDGLIGYLDQDPRFPSWMTARELLQLVGELYGQGGAGLRGRIEETLEVAGLADAARRAIGTFSGGMRQRLGLAQAILHRPPVLLLDEPVSSLDPEGRHDLLSLIARLGAESTVLFSTHILSDVERVCDHVAILDHGRLVTTAPMDELLDRYAQPVFRLETDTGGEAALAAVADAVRDAPWVSGLEHRPGVLRVATRDPLRDGPELLAAVAAQRVPLLAFERQRPTLEDIFLQLVGRQTNEERPS